MLQISCFFRFFAAFAAKTLKMTISTSIWSAQHPNAGQNIQQGVIWRAQVQLVGIVPLKYFVSGGPPPPQHTQTLFNATQKLLSKGTSPSPIGLNYVWVSDNVNSQYLDRNFNKLVCLLISFETVWINIFCIVTLCLTFHFFNTFGF